jgi:hypothetical protein
MIEFVSGVEEDIWPEPMLSALLDQLPRVAPMVRALAQRLSDESEVRHRDCSRRCRRDVGGEGESIAKGGICVRRNRQWVCFAIAREGGRRGERGRRCVRRFWTPKALPIVPQERLAHKLFFSRGFEGSAERRAAQLRAVRRGDMGWARVAVFARGQSTGTGGGVESMRSESGCWMG